MLHRGFLHRDIGIPTVFLLPNPVEMTPFVPGNFEHALGKTGKDDKVLQDQVERLREGVTDLGIAGACSGVVQPSGMAVGMKDYYSSGGNSHRSASVRRFMEQYYGCNNLTGQLRVHVFWAIEVYPAFGTIPPFSR